MKVSGSQEIISRLDNWRKNHVSNRELVLVLAFAIGLLASLAAYILHFIIKLIEELVPLVSMLQRLTGSISSIQS